MMRPEWEKLDPGGMGQAIRTCHEQILAALAEPAWKPAVVRPFDKILYLGMGGSAIGGDMVRVWSERTSAVPLTVQRDYGIPGWVDGKTLVLASSYAGNTEETLSAAGMAAAAGAQLVAITSGGELARQARAEDWQLLQIPGGFQPRAAIGYSLAAICRVLVAYQVLPQSLVGELGQAAKLMGSEAARWTADGSANLALATAELIADRQVVIYGTTGTTEALAVRMRGQLAENGNLFAGHHLLPELNHNEIVGLKDRLASDDSLVVVWLADAEDHPRVALRRQLTAELTGLRKAGETVPGPHEVVLSGAGKTLLERNMTLLNLVDWISLYTALLRGQDPTAIDVLLALKERLAPRV